jgi:hypothetical protein
VKFINCIWFLVLLTGQKRKSTGMLAQMQSETLEPQAATNHSQRNPMSHGTLCLVCDPPLAFLQQNIPAHVRAKTHFSQNCCLWNGELIPKKTMFRGTNYMLSCRFCRPIQLLPNSASSRVPQGVLRNAFQCPAKSPFAFQQWDLWHLRPSTHKGESKCSASTWGFSHQLKKYWSLSVSYY